MQAPQFLFIFGAAGSGNTFMFSCLTQDKDVYGVNEDAFGSTLERLLLSEKEMGKCPHSLEAFGGFLQALRKDRRTLILKTPSNLRRVAILRQHVPQARFLCMLREPHAAIVSGLSRHQQTVEEVAKIWESDCRLLLEQRGDDLTVVTYQRLAQDPAELLEQLSQTVLPLSADVFTYATRMHRPERSGEAWWQGKVAPEVQAEIRDWVRRLDLESLYREASGDSTQTSLPARTFRVNPLVRAKKEFFRGWYKVFQ